MDAFAFIPRTRIIPPAMLTVVEYELAALSPDKPLPGVCRPSLLLLAINLFNYVDRQVLAAVEPLIREHFGASQAQMGWLATAFLVSYMVFSPLFGWLGDRISRWMLVAVGVILWSLASGGSGLATTFTILLITRCFVGIGEAAYGPVAPTILSDLYPVAIRGRILSWFYLAIPVGSALGYVVGGQIADGRRRRQLEPGAGRSTSSSSPACSWASGRSSCATRDRARPTRRTAAGASAPEAVIGTPAALADYLACSASPPTSSTAPA